MLGVECDVMAVQLRQVLETAVRSGASDVHLKVGRPPMFRVDGRLVPLRNGEKATPQDLVFGRQRNHEPVSGRIF